MALTEWTKLIKEEREKILAEGAAKRIAQIYARGLPTTHGDIHGVYRIYPDGRKFIARFIAKIKREKEDIV